VATADELVDSIRKLTDVVVEHAESTDARIDALANALHQHAESTDARLDALTTEVRYLTTELRDLKTETRDGFRDLDRRIGRLENGTGPVASNR